ncbi:uncharacterized protein G2W53_034884 [Senna tora]|uniref:Uncharacterized protein n=1 Tax=Senna tora TaxID=362788 RepID=A0A834T008_9FABA|nr:uncharacterized protein G2W53_034884 [Senna tora]
MWRNLENWEHIIQKERKNKILLVQHLGEGNMIDDNTKESLVQSAMMKKKIKRTEARAMLLRSMMDRNAERVTRVVVKVAARRLY